MHRAAFDQTEREGAMEDIARSERVDRLYGKPGDMLHRMPGPFSPVAPLRASGNGCENIIAAGQYRDAFAQIRRSRQADGGGF